MSSTDKLINKILKMKHAFIEDNGVAPAILLVSKKNFLKIRNWQIEVKQDTSRLLGMLILIDDQVDIFVGGL